MIRERTEVNQITVLLIHSTNVDGAPVSRPVWTLGIEQSSMVSTLLGLSACFPAGPSDCSTPAPHRRRVKEL